MMIMTLPLPFPSNCHYDVHFHGIN